MSVASGPVFVTIHVVYFVALLLFLYVCFVYACCCCYYCCSSLTGVFVVFTLLLCCCCIFFAVILLFTYCCIGIDFLLNNTQSPPVVSAFSLYNNQLGSLFLTEIHLLLRFTNSIDTKKKFFFIL